MSHNVRESYIVFPVPITLRSVQELFNILRNKLREGTESLTILISSPGGQVNAGISAYNFLKGIPAEVITHNTGQVDSIGVVVFCAGSKRYCSPDTRFLIHGIGFDAKEGQRFNEGLLAERLEGLKNERITVSKIISNNTKKSLEEVENDMYKGVVWTPEQSIDYGLVHEIRTQLFEKGAIVEQVNVF
jgi:ATP-dependent Clp endopeptidase proteolytic subunit ClpP